MNARKQKEIRFQKDFWGSSKLYLRRTWTQYDACSSVKMMDQPERLWGIYPPSKSQSRTKKTSKFMLQYGTRNSKLNLAHYAPTNPISGTLSRQGPKVRLGFLSPIVYEIPLTLPGMFIFAEVLAKYLEGQLTRADLLEELNPAKLPVQLDDV